MVAAGERPRRPRAAHRGLLVAEDRSRRARLRLDAAAPAAFPVRARARPGADRDTSTATRDRAVTLLHGLGGLAPRAAHLGGLLRAAGRAARACSAGVTLPA